MTDSIDWDVEPDEEEVEADAPTLSVADSNYAPLLNPPSPCSTCG